MSRIDLILTLIEMGYGVMSGLHWADCDAHFVCKGSDLVGTIRVYEPGDGESAEFTCWPRNPLDMQFP